MRSMIMILYQKDIYFLGKGFKYLILLLYKKNLLIINSI